MATHIEEIQRFLRTSFKNWGIRQQDRREITKTKDCLKKPYLSVYMCIMYTYIYTYIYHIFIYERDTYIYVCIYVCFPNISRCSDIYIAYAVCKYMCKYIYIYKCIHMQITHIYICKYICI